MQLQQLSNLRSGSNSAARATATTATLRASAAAVLTSATATVLGFCVTRSSNFLSFNMNNSAARVTRSGSLLSFNIAYVGNSGHRASAIAQSQQQQHLCSSITI
jgi:hypothetical protein